ncbi:hypothetical protein [Paenibacillus sp. FSL E2-0178]|uniref:hypothetical protein n=1 Tax=Paenibacillus sp. FSL E2-0178 TaxID=2921361 RepID=UPI003158127F
MARKNTGEFKVDVWNNSMGRVSFILDDKKYLWDKVGAKKSVDLDILKELVNITGGYTLLNEELLIKESSIREELGLPVSPGQMLDAKGITELLGKSSVEIETILSDSNNAVLEKVAAEAIKQKISDLDKMDVIEKYSGVDVLSAIKELKEDAK